MASSSLVLPRGEEEVKAAPMSSQLGESVAVSWCAVEKSERALRFPCASNPPTRGRDEAEGGAGRAGAGVPSGNRNLDPSD